MGASYYPMGVFLSLCLEGRYVFLAVFLRFYGSMLSKGISVLVVGFMVLCLSVAI
jgi:hypothetical protein